MRRIVAVSRCSVVSKTPTPLVVSQYDAVLATLPWDYALSTRLSHGWLDLGVVSLRVELLSRLLCGTGSVAVSGR